MNIKDVLPTKKCKAFDFDVPCPESPEKTLFGMLLESDTERTCFALSIKKRLQTWDEKAWNLFLKYQKDLYETGYENMGRFLASDLCKNELDSYAPQSAIDFIHDTWGPVRYVLPAPIDNNPTDHAELGRGRLPED